MRSRIIIAILLAVGISSVGISYATISYSDSILLTNHGSSFEIGDNGTSISRNDISGGAADLIIRGFSDIVFKTSGTTSYGTGIENMRIVSSDGNVGIGTSNPASSLDIKGEKGIAISGSNYNDAYRITRNVMTGMLNITGKQNAYSGFNFGTNSSGTIITSLTIVNNGNIGIGTTNPAQKLDVNGNIKVEGNITSFLPSADTFKITSANNGPICIGNGC